MREQYDYIDALRGFNILMVYIFILQVWSLRVLKAM